MGPGPPNRQSCAVSPAVLGLGVLAALLAFGCENSARLPTPDVTSAADPVVDVVTARVRRGSIVQPISAPGTLVARRESRIGAEVRARIVRVYVSEGDRVRTGDPLFEIDSEAYEMALRQAVAGVDVARAERLQLEADLARAHTLQRQNVIAEQEIERLKTSLAVAQATERQASEAVALARHNLERTVVRAPYSGSIAARLADEGTTALVQPQTIVVVLQETTELEARAAIPESQLSLIRLGDRAVVHVEGLPQPIQTEIAAVSDSVEPATRTYLIKMRVPNPDHRLKAGIFAHVRVFPQAKTGVLLVPREAIRTEDGRSRLLVVADGRADAVAVQVGIVSEDAAEVLGGVAEGDEVVVGEGARTIAPGLRVRVVGTQDTAA